MSFRCLSRAGLLIGFLGVCLADLPFYQQAVGQEPKNQKWEYCVLIVKGSTEKTTEYSVTKGKELIKATSLKELGEKLKMKDTPTLLVEVLDHLGDQGWELVGHSGAVLTSSPFSAIDLWCLKRKK
jgi:hypothetical protein